MPYRNANLWGRSGNDHMARTVSGLLKLLYPDEQYDKEAVRRCLEYAISGPPPRH